jgi:hypothetical protein
VLLKFYHLGIYLIATRQRGGPELSGIWFRNCKDVTCQIKSCVYPQKNKTDAMTPAAGSRWVNCVDVRSSRSRRGIYPNFRGGKNDVNVHRIASSERIGLCSLEHYHSIRNRMLRCIRKRQDAFSRATFAPLAVQKKTDDVNNQLVGGGTWNAIDNQYG